MEMFRPKECEESNGIIAVFMIEMTPTSSILIIYLVQYIIINQKLTLQ